MLRDHLRRLAGRANVPLGTIEKDFMTHLLLVVLAEVPDFEQLAFKGGTCIRKLYVPEARFSVDLDFNAPEAAYPALRDALRARLTDADVHGIRFLEVQEAERGANGARLSLKHAETGGHPTSLKLDLSFREPPVEPPEQRPILNPLQYPLPDATVRALSLEEILAEKVRATIARGTPRDVYDIGFLLDRGVRLRPELIHAKLQVLRSDRAFQPSRFLAQVEAQRGAWQRDLHPLLGAVPNFDEVRATIAAAVERAGFDVD